MSGPLMRCTLLVSALALVVGACTDAESDTATTSSPSTTTTAATPTSTTAATTVAPTAGPSYRPTFTPDECEFAVPEGRDAECGWLGVPADRSDPDGPTVRLPVAVFASEAADPAPDPVVYLDGGPGSDSLELLPLLFEDSFAHLLADRDVIIFDQRGNGYSEPSLACPEYREFTLATLDDDLETDDLIRQQNAVFGQCRDRLLADGVDLNDYTSATNAADVADLRVALGYDEWNLYGISYGTRLALTVMRDHPEGIRSVVLDSAYPPQVDVVAEAPANLDRALTTLFTACAADATCAGPYPDLESDFFDLVEALDASPIRVPVTDVFTGEVYDAVMDGAGLGGVVFQSLYSEDAIPVLPQLVKNVGAGETYELSVLLSSFLANGEFVSMGTMLSVQCHDESGFSSPSIVRTALDAYPELETIFGGSPNVGPAFFDLCSEWGTRQAPPIENEPVTSEIPALVLAGEFDPITPPLWGRVAAQSLPQSTYVEFPGLGHGVSVGGECPQSIMRAFLNDPSAPPDQSCVASMGPPAWLTPDTPAPDVTLIPYTDSLFGAEWSGVVPDGWERQAPGTWARGLTGFDQTAVIQQFGEGIPPALLLGVLGTQFGLGNDPQSVGEYLADNGTWMLYEGSFAGSPASLAVAEIGAGTFVVVLVAAPSDIDRLEAEVFFPALDAVSVG